DADGKLLRDIDIEKMTGQRANSDIIDPKTGEEFVKAGRRITRAVVKKIQTAGINKIEVTREDLDGKVIAAPLIDEGTGEIIADVNQEVTADIIARALDAGITEFRLIFFDGISVGPYLRNTLLIDKVVTKEESLLEIYKR